MATFWRHLAPSWFFFLVPGFTQYVLHIRAPSTASSETQGLCLKTFVTPFLPARLTAPGSPRMLPQRNTAVVSFVSSRKARLCGEVRCVTKLRTVVQQTISLGYGAGDMKGVFLLSKMIFKRGSSGAPNNCFL